MYPEYSVGYFINQPENPTEFEITFLETMEEPQVEDLHRHTFYEILWIKQGVSTQIIDHQNYVIGSNTLFFISPGQLHYFEEWDELEGICLMFTESFLIDESNLLFEMSFLDNFYQNPYLVLQADETEFFQATVDLLWNEKKSFQNREPIIKQLLKLILLHIQSIINRRDEKNSEIRKDFLMYKKFKILTDKHFRTALTVSDYASELHLSAQRLNSTVKNVTGKTAGELISERKLLEAKRLLALNHLTVAEIAFDLGYEDVSYFIRRFRQQEQITPVAYRTRLTEKYRT